MVSRYEGSSLGKERSIMVQKQTLNVTHSAVFAEHIAIRNVIISARYTEIGMEKVVMIVFAIG